MAGAGLTRILKSFGQMTAQDSEGNVVVWVWDHVNNKAVIKRQTIKSKPQL